MILEHKVIKIKEKPLFEKARFKTPYGMNYQMKDLACFFYVLKGSYQVVEKHGDFRLGTNEALIKQCGNYVTRFLKNEAHHECEAVAIYLYPEVLKDIYKHQIPTFLKELKEPVPPRKMVANELIEKFINNLLIYFDNPNLIDEELAFLKIKELIMILLKSEHYKNVQKFFIDIFSPKKLAFTSVIENNIFSDISIEDLAFICNKSLSSFKREFKTVYNETPARYIKKRRLEHAARLLKSSDDPVSTIAYESGFQDVSTFSYAFTQKFGVPPSQFRMTEIGR